MNSKFLGFPKAPVSVPPAFLLPSAPSLSLANAARPSRAASIKQQQLHLPLHVPRVAATSSPATSRWDSTSGSGLVEWITREGGFVHEAVDTRYLGPQEGFGVILKAPVKEGTQLVVLPPRCQISLWAAGNNGSGHHGQNGGKSHPAHPSHPAILRLAEQVPEELSGAKLALQLLYERSQGEASPYHPYLAMLPAGAPLPIFWRGQAIQALEYAPVTSQVVKRCRFLAEFSKGPLAALTQNKDANPFGRHAPHPGTNDLGWSMAMVTSRAFRTRGESEPPSLLPLIDLCNHSFDNNVFVRPYGIAGSLELVASKGIDAGSELLNCYGQLPNDYLLMDYGFIPPSNPYDSVRLKFDLPAFEGARALAGLSEVPVGSGVKDEIPQLYAWQQMALSDIGLVVSGPRTNPEVELGSPLGKGIDRRLLAALRVLYCRDAALVRGKSAADLGDPARPLDLRSEARALSTVASLCLVSLSSFTASAADDVRMLEERVYMPPAPRQPQHSQGQAQATAPPPEGIPMDSQLESALFFRIGKKRILTEMLDHVAERVKVIKQKAEMTSMGRAMEMVRKGEVPAEDAAGGEGASGPSSSGKGKARGKAGGRKAAPGKQQDKGTAKRVRGFGSGQGGPSTGA